MDVLTLSYVNLFIGIAACVLFILLYKQDTGQKHLLYWLLAGLCLLLSAVFGILSSAELQMPYWLRPAAANTLTVSLHVLLLAGLLQFTQYPYRKHWIPGLLLIVYAVNLSDFAQAALAHRLLLNFAIIIVINFAAISVLLRQTHSAFRGVYLSFIIALAFNIVQMAARYLILQINSAERPFSATESLIHSIGYFGLTTYSMLMFGSCLYLVYRQQRLALLHTAERDALTGVYNRHVLEQKLHTELQRSQRRGQSCSVLMLDIDHFKQINDSYGHVVGDQAIYHVAGKIEQQLRSYDVIFRYGGEEFLLCLPDTDKTAALHIANRIRKHIEQSPLQYPAAIALTVSVGVATYSGGTIHWQQLITQADNALYQSKQRGRNQTWHYSQLLTDAD